MRESTAATQWPGDPGPVWARISTSSPPRLDRPREAPRPDSVEEVAQWEDPDGFGRVELYYAPAFWVFLPLVALGYLVWGVITDPGDGWTNNLLDDDATGNLWNFWLVWLGVGIWLLVAIGVLILRASATPVVRADNAWIFEHGVPHTIHPSPFTRDGGEGFMSPTFIAIDHRVGDEQAARIHEALYRWLSDEAVQKQLNQGLLRRPYGVISSREVFGDEADGGYYVESVPGLGTSDDDGPQWGLITEPSRDGAEVSVTAVPVGKKRDALRRKAERRRNRL